jgi:hypothetical protein
MKRVIFIESYQMFVLYLYVGQWSPPFLCPLVIISRNLFSGRHPIGDGDCPERLAWQSGGGGACCTRLV